MMNVHTVTGSIIKLLTVLATLVHPSVQFTILELLCRSFITALIPLTSMLCYVRSLSKYFFMYVHRSVECGTKEMIYGENGTEYSMLTLHFVGIIPSLH